MLNNKEQVLQILDNIYTQSKDPGNIFLNLIKLIKNDSIFNRKLISIRIQYFQKYLNRHPEVIVSIEDINHVINYLDSIIIIQKLNK